MNKYRQRAFTKMSRFYSRRIETKRYWYPVPGNRAHLTSLGEKSHIPFAFFLRRVNKGRVIGSSINKLNSLYWRLHESL